jgi:hypothetical protein
MPERSKKKKKKKPRGPTHVINMSLGTLHNNFHCEHHIPGPGNGKKIHRYPPIWHQSPCYVIGQFLREFVLHSSFFTARRFETAHTS